MHFQQVMTKVKLYPDFSDLMIEEVISCLSRLLGKYMSVHIIDLIMK